MRLLLLAMTGCCAGAAQAAISTITETATLPPEAADYTLQPLSFAQFDPSLGKLQSVQIVVHSTMHLTQQFENTSDQEQNIRARQTVDFVLTLPDGTTPFLKDRQVVARTYSVSEFDGTVDFDGTSGSTTDYQISSTNQKRLKSRDKLDMFTGSGLASLFLSANETFQASDEQNQLVAQSQAFAGAKIDVIYNYIAIPEPVAFGLVAGSVALLSFGAINRRANRIEKK